ncbi:hypothetical protein COLO4_34229 [Corchorus olitorius]|uniref:Uncharacterized protein n=1 Tax=Corchorus olitorius TaxID=93759 RepID=A0A1R3GN22_9ROSI|nr:hypothetical protein COLO4_34229 [Corchorus olitorius]
MEQQTAENSTANQPSREEIQCTTPTHEEIPDLSGNAKSQAASSGCGNAEAVASVVLPNQQSATVNPTVINSSSKAQSGGSKRKKAKSDAPSKKKTRFSVMDNNGRVLNVSGERSSPASQAKYANQRPITATSLQHDAHNKFKKRMEGLKFLRDCDQLLVETGGKTRMVLRRV